MDNRWNGIYVFWSFSTSQVDGFSGPQVPIGLGLCWLDGPGFRGQTHGEESLWPVLRVWCHQPNRDFLSMSLLLSLWFQRHTSSDCFDYPSRLPVFVQSRDLDSGLRDFSKRNMTRNVSFASHFHANLATSLKVHNLLLSLLFSDSCNKIILPHHASPFMTFYIIQHPASLDLGNRTPLSVHDSLSKL